MVWGKSGHSFQCSVAEVFYFLQTFLEKSKAFSTIKGSGDIMRPQTGAGAPLQPVEVYFYLIENCTAPSLNPANRVSELTRCQSFLATVGIWGLQDAFDN